MASNQPIAKPLSRYQRRILRELRNWPDSYLGLAHKRPVFPDWSKGRGKLRGYEPDGYRLCNVGTLFKDVHLKPETVEPLLPELQAYCWRVKP